MGPRKRDPETRIQVSARLAVTPGVTGKEGGEPGRGIKDILSSKLPCGPLWLCPAGGCQKRAANSRHAPTLATRGWSSPAFTSHSQQLAVAPTGNACSVGLCVENLELEASPAQGQGSDSITLSLPWRPGSLVQTPEILQNHVPALQRHPPSAHPCSD